MLLQQNDQIRKAVNINEYLQNNYDGSSVHMVIFDTKGSPHESLKDISSAPFCKEKIHSHATNTASTINQMLPKAKITMLYNSDECKEYFKQIADTVDIINISLTSTLKAHAEYSWGFLEQYDIPIFSSSGNYYDDELEYPSRFPWVISVGAYLNDKVPNYSNYEIGLLDCVGFTNVWVLNSENELHKFTHTSCASPQTASSFGAYVDFIKKNLNKKVTRQESFNFIHNNCVDIEGDRDGNGVFILPSLFKLKSNLIDKKEQFESETIITLPSISKPENKKYYHCQVGAYKNKINCENYAKGLKNKGYSTYIVEVDGYFKIQMGAFSIETNARNFSEKLKLEGINNFIVYY